MATGRIAENRTKYFVTTGKPLYQSLVAEVVEEVIIYVNMADILQ
jgi:hypothetical protein